MFISINRNKNNCNNCCQNKSRKWFIFKEVSKNIDLKIDFGSELLIFLTSDLEKELGIVIFDREPKGVSLTPAGEEFLEGAKLLAQSFRQLETRYGLNVCYQKNL